MVPPLNDEARDFLNMFALRDRVERSQSPSITLNFEHCTFIRHTGVAFLAGLIRWAATHGKTIEIEWSSVRDHIRTNLQQNGFASAFGDTTHGPWRGNSVPFREDRIESSNDILTYLARDWLGRGWVKVSQALAAAIQGRVWEIYSNCFEHSGSSIGAMSCGQRYPKQSRLGLCVADFGVGIPEKVRAFRNRPRLSAAEAMRWAFESGTSTKPDLRKGRGIGLNLLKDFVKLNNGKLSIYSGRGQAHIDGTGEKFVDGALEFRGTMVDIRFTCDENRYLLASEVPSGGLF
jgi:signal transduction histidine kinase